MINEKAWKKTADNWREHCDNLRVTIEAYQKESQLQCRRINALKAENARLREALARTARELTDAKSGFVCEVREMAEELLGPMKTISKEEWDQMREIARRGSLKPSRGEER